MRNNLPVTGAERPVPAGRLIVSKTDTRGVITFANGAFVEICGFTEQELIGQPHNIVRHPDMPPEAFADLWSTLASGSTWSGAVKNRHKSGDHYWVSATAIPILENGAVTGYMSVRTELPEALKHASEAAYRDFREGRAAGKAIAFGVVVSTTRLARIMARFSTVRARLILQRAAAAGALALVALTGALSESAWPPVVLALVLGAAGWWQGTRVSRTVLQNIKDVTAVIAALSQGDFSRSIFNRTGGDGRAGDRLPRTEFTAMKEQVKALQTRILFEREETVLLAEKQRRLEDEARTLEAQQRAEKEEAQERMRREQEARVAALEAAMGEFREKSAGLLAEVGQATVGLKQTSDAMVDTASQTNQRAAAVAAASEQTSSNVQTVAAAVEEFSHSISEINGQVERTSNIANRAVDDTSKAAEMVNSLVGASARIGQVVSLISEIAEQTNLLAVNATIEAARAGDAGKGFAIVAGEVKQLAAQTARATDEIDGKVHEIAEATRGTCQAIENVRATIIEMCEIAAGIAVSVDQQSAATVEISRSIQEAAMGTREVSGNIRAVTEAAEVTGNAAGEVMRATDVVARQSDGMAEEISSFLQRVAAI